MNESKLDIFPLYVCRLQAVGRTAYIVSIKAFKGTRQLPMKEHDNLDWDTSAGHYFVILIGRHIV